MMEHSKLAEFARLHEYVIAYDGLQVMLNE
jgi:hypothetical protein